MRRLERLIEISGDIEERKFFAEEGYESVAIELLEK